MVKPLFYRKKLGVKRKGRSVPKSSTLRLVLTKIAIDVRFLYFCFEGSIFP